MIVRPQAIHGDGDMMPSPAKTWHHHLLRLSPIEMNLQTLPWASDSSASLAANEIHRAGGSAQIKHPRMEAHPCPNSREKQSALVMVVLFPAGGVVSGQLLQQLPLFVVQRLGSFTVTATR